MCTSVKAWGALIIHLSSFHYLTYQHDEMSNRGRHGRAVTDRHGVCSSIEFARKQILQSPCIDVSTLNYLLHRHLEDFGVRAYIYGNQGNQTRTQRNPRVYTNEARVMSALGNRGKRGGAVRGGDAIFCTGNRGKVHSRAKIILCEPKLMQV